MPRINVDEFIARLREAMLDQDLRPLEPIIRSIGYHQLRELAESHGLHLDELEEILAEL